MPTKNLPATPDLDQLKHQAKDLRKAHRAADPEALQRIREFHPRFSNASDSDIASAPFTLSDAQLSIAREYGFASWLRLKAYVQNPTREKLSLPAHERITDPLLRRAVDLVDAGDEKALRELLADHPDLVHRRALLEGGNYFRNPSLLEFIAENPIRHGKLPPNIRSIARIILEFGPPREAISEALALVCSGCVPREQGVQIDLLDLLCDFGADPNTAMQPAIGHGEFGAVHALLRRGANLTLPVAAALEMRRDVQNLLSSASSEERHLALAYAAQFGREEVLRLLLDAGEDPSRYNPVGAHSHSTLLHQAALAGHESVVRLLLERGGRRDLKDTIYHATPEGWARHAGHAAIARLLEQPSPKELIEKAMTSRWQAFQLVEQQISAARRDLEQAIAIARETGSRRNLIEGLKALGQLDRDSGDHERALELYVEAVEFCRHESDDLLLAHTVRHLADIYVDLDRLEPAGPLYDEAMKLYRSNPVTSDLDLANAVRPTAILQERIGALAEARRLWTEGRALYAAAGIEAGVEECEAHLAKLHQRS